MCVLPRSCCITCSCQHTAARRYGYTIISASNQNKTVLGVEIAYRLNVFRPKFSLIEFILKANNVGCSIYSFFIHMICMIHTYIIRTVCLYVYGRIDVFTVLSYSSESCSIDRIYLSIIAAQKCLYTLDKDANIVLNGHYPVLRTIHRH